MKPLMKSLNPHSTKLVAMIRAGTGQPRYVAHWWLTRVLESIQAMLLNGESVTLRGVGRLHVTRRKGRTTFQKKQPDRMVVRFKSSPRINNKLNQKS